MKKNTRNFPRMTVRIRVVYHAAAEEFRDYATTLGAGGLFIETDTPPRPGTSLKLSFELREGGRAYEMEGRVTWVTGARERANSKPGFGVQFVDPVGVSMLARELEEFGAPNSRRGRC